MQPLLLSLHPLLPPPLTTSNTRIDRQPQPDDQTTYRKNQDYRYEIEVLLRRLAHHPLTAALLRQLGRCRPRDVWQQVWALGPGRVVDDALLQLC